MKTIDLVLLVTSIFVLIFAAFAFHVVLIDEPDLVEIETDNGIKCVIYGRSIDCDWSERK